MVLFSIKAGISTTTPSLNDEKYLFIWEMGIVQIELFDALSIW